MTEDPKCNLLTLRIKTNIIWEHGDIYSPIIFKSEFIKKKSELILLKKIIQKQCFQILSEILLIF